MKKAVWMVLFALVTVGMMAQPPHGQRGRDNRGPGDRPGHGREKIECATNEQLHMSLQVLENQTFDERRLEVAQLCVTLGRFCTNDLERMARKFSFDDNRKKFLTYAYRYCSDPWNYYSLRDVFEYRSNFDEMMDSVYR